jgi:transcription initiation factor TFIIB
MRVRDIFGEEGSDVSNANEHEHYDVRNVGWRPTCPECDGRVVSEGVESVCADCGLVVTIDALQRSPTLQANAPTTADRVGEWAVETVDDLRVDRGLHTTFFLRTDGKGNRLSRERMDRMERLRRRHKRFTMADDRDKRLNEGFRDIGMVGANLELPAFVQVDAARFLERAKTARLPGGRMAWESLAGASVLLAARKAGHKVEPAAVAEFAKTDEERLCAAARKLRLETDVEAPPVRARCVDRVVAALADHLDVATGIELVRVADRLLDLADSEPVGPGTPRMTMAGAAVYAADRLTSGKSLTRADVVRAVETVLPTSKTKVGGYSRKLREAADQRRWAEGVAGLVAAD